jgi:hypothetical protein
MARGTRRRLFLPAAVVAVMVVASACNLLTGVSDFETGVDDTFDAPNRDSRDGLADAPGTERGDAGQGGDGPGTLAEAGDARCTNITTPLKRATKATTTSTSTGSWNTPNQALVADTDEATLVFMLPDATSGILQVSEFGFSVPASATITGVTVRIVRFGNVIQVQDSSVKLYAAGMAIGANRAALGMSWPTGSTPRDYGTVEDLWGANLTPAVVNASTFGAGISVRYVTPAGGGPIAYVDEISMSISYCAP